MTHYYDSSDVDIWAIQCPDRERGMKGLLEALELSPEWVQRFDKLIPAMVLGQLDRQCLEENAWRIKILRDHGWEVATVPAGKKYGE